MALILFKSRDLIFRSGLRLRLKALKLSWGYLQLLLTILTVTEERQFVFESFNFVFQFSDVHFFLLSGLLSCLSVFKFLNIILFVSGVGGGLLGLGLIDNVGCSV